MSPNQFNFVLITTHKKRKTKKKKQLYFSTISRNKDQQQHYYNRSLTVNPNLSKEKKKNKKNVCKLNSL